MWKVSLLWTSGRQHNTRRHQRNRSTGGQAHKGHNGQNKTFARLLGVTGGSRLNLFGEQHGAGSAQRRRIPQRSQRAQPSRGHFFLSDHSTYPPNNGAILNVAQIIKNVMSSAAEAELGALFICAREAVYIRHILKAMGHPQPRRRFKQTTRRLKAW